MTGLEAVAVHTTGVNIEGVLANVASITVVLGAFGALLVKAMKNSIGAQINDAVDKKVTPILNQIQAQLNTQDNRIARLEGIEQGKRYALDAAGVTTNHGA